jgi:hypothetical protein
MLPMHETVIRAFRQDREREIQRMNAPSPPSDRLRVLLAHWRGTWGWPRRAGEIGAPSSILRADPALRPTLGPVRRA